MAKGIMYVESMPSSPDRLDEYHAWYDETHLRDVVGVEGIVSARRFAPVADDGPFVAIYELEADDLQAVLTSLVEAFGRGEVPMSDAIEMDPPPTFRLLELRASYEPGGSA